MLESDEGFDDFFYNQSNINKFLKTAILGKSGEEISLTGFYNSSDGGKLNKTKYYKVPNSSKRIIFVDGVGVGNFVNEVVAEDNGKAEVQGISILDDPADSILRALIRDLQNKKGIDLKERTLSRIKEYTVKMWEWIYKDVRDTKHIVFNDSLEILENNMKLLLDSDKSLTKEIIFKGILDGIEEFEKQKIREQNDNDKKWSNKIHLAKQFSSKLVENLRKRLNVE